MENIQTYCLCGQRYESGKCMIQCDCCRDWFHFSCVSLKEYNVHDIDKFHCPRCLDPNGPSIYLQRTNWHRNNMYEKDPKKGVQSGTISFVKELQLRHFARAQDIVLYMRGQQLTEYYLKAMGFDKPIIIEGKDGLDMTLPPSNFSLYDVESYVGSDMSMDVIDVNAQKNFKMKLRDFVEYFNDPDRSKVFNVISLEFSKTGLSPLVEAPLVARKIDWVNTVWPREDFGQPKRPEVQKYCLMSVKDSYTDFHIDFGGTSVWYHVLRGEKVFFLIEPTEANLTLYRHWMNSKNHSETFFGDQADVCYKVVLRQGQTMFIPTGWVHAVLTTMDSLVFGGNFLHSLNISMQLEVYEIEKKTKAPEKFRFPLFECINWFAARRIIAQLQELNEQDQKCPNRLLEGSKALLTALKHWNLEKDYCKILREHIPEVNTTRILKDLSKEIRHAERYLISINPPKPERESKRKKKKPINNDFDYSQPSLSELEILASKQCLTPTRSVIKLNSNLSSELKPPLKLTLPKPAMYPYVNSPMYGRSPGWTAPGEGDSISSLDSDHKGGKVRPSQSDTSIETEDSFHVYSQPLPASPAQQELIKDTSSALKFKLGERVEIIHADLTSLNVSFKNTGRHILQSPIKFIKEPVEHDIYIQHSLLTPQNSQSSVSENMSDSQRLSSDLNFQSGSELLTIPYNKTIYVNKHSPTFKPSIIATTNNTDHSQSVYDFHDDSDNGVDSDNQNMCINESPRRRKKFKDEVMSTGRLKMKIPASLYKRCNRTGATTIITEAEVDVVTECKNGIESLIKASDFTNTFIDSRRASPSTQEAIAGMLSMGRPRSGTSKKRRKSLPIDEIEESVNNVHQDEDYVYPSLDNSDDEEYVFKPRGKVKVDEAWNPKARVGPLLPKMNRPAREGTRKQPVVKVLEAAAAKRAIAINMKDRILPLTKRPYIRRKKCKTIMASVNLPVSILSSISPESTQNQSHDIAGPSSAPSSIQNASNTKLASPHKSNKLRKGMKTAKQRLGKILKLHKMMK